KPPSLQTSLGGVWYTANMGSIAATDAALSFMSQASDAYLQPPFPTVEQGLSLIDEGEPEQLSTDCLHSDLEWFASCSARSTRSAPAGWPRSTTGSARTTTRPGRALRPVAARLKGLLGPENRRFRE